MKCNYIGGRWVETTNGAADVNPSDKNDTVDVFAQSDAAHIDEAIESARDAFPAWRRASPQMRADVLDRCGTELLARSAELGELLSREQGKVLADGVGEVVRAGNVFKFFSGEALRLAGDNIASTRPGVEVAVCREPLGIIGIITPWNFPLAIPAWKIAPALAAGNCVIFKPADLVPASAWALTEILSRAGLPAGVFNLVMGKGSKLGSKLVGSVDALTFTGSGPVGREIARVAADRLTRVQLEMGGKSPLLVLDDAHLETAVESAANGAFYMAGQRCTASSRLIVTKGIHDRFVDALTERMSRVRIGNALAKDSDIGPVVDEKQLLQDLSYVTLGEREGAKRVFGGDPLERDTEGFYFNPCLFTETTSSMRINQEEIFGPIASVIRVNDYDEALAVANDTEYGLSSGICTSSLKFSSHFRANSIAGVVMVNLPTSGIDYHVPFGGRKASSFGPRELGRAGIDFYTTTKTSYIRADAD